MIVQYSGPGRKIDATKMRFVVLTDTHFFAPELGKDGTYWNRTLHSRSQEIGEALIESVSAFNPAFVIHCGDFTGRCDTVNFEMGRRIMNQIGCPWFLVIGNHDTWYPGVREAISNLYGLSHDQCYYSRSLSGLRFIFLDMCYWRSRDGSISPYLDKDSFDRGMIDGFIVPPEEMYWLRDELETYKNEKVILVGHAPLAFKSAYPKGMPEGLANGKELRRLLRGYSNIAIAFAGHWHINDIYVEEGIVFCQTCSLREYPFEFRVVDFDHDTLSITTHGLNNSKFNQLSLMPEKGNHWVAGTSRDREFLLRFRFKSQPDEVQL